MAQLFYKYLCLFLVSYVFIGFGMEEPSLDEYTINTTQIVPINTAPARAPYDLAVNEYAEGYYEVSERPILTREQALEHVPFKFQENQINQTPNVQPRFLSSNDGFFSPPIANDIARERKRSLQNMRSDNRAFRYDYVRSNKIRNEFIAMIADNFNDEDAMREIRSLCRTKQDHELFGEAAKFVRKNPALQHDPSLWPKGVDYKPRPRDICGNYRDISLPTYYYGQPIPQQHPEKQPEPQQEQPK